MNITHKIHDWEQPKHDLIVLIFRVALGIIITLKGIIFLSNPDLLNTLITHSSLYRFAETFWVWYIALANLLCGIFIITGLFTRVAILFQIPVLAGAVFFINPGGHSFAFNGELIISVLALAALFYFFIKGPGEVSMDNYLRNHDI